MNLYISFCKISWAQSHGLKGVFCDGRGKVKETHLYTLLPSRLDFCECEKPAGNRDFFFDFIYFIKSSVVDPLKNLIELKKMPFLNENFHYTHIFTKLIFLNDLFSGIFIHFFSEFVTVIFFLLFESCAFFYWYTI